MPEAELNSSTSPAIVSVAAPAARLHAGEPAATPATARRRLYYMDNLRVFVIIATVIHHAANPYAGDPTWFYQSRDGINEWISPIQLLTPSYSMSVLLIFSGFLLAGSYERRSMKSFFWNKFMHLGIPLLIGFLIYIPLMQFWHHINYRAPVRVDHWYEYIPMYWHYYWNIWHGLGGRPDDWQGAGWPDRHLAHLWYIEHLFVYSVLYGLWRWFFHRDRIESAPLGPAPGHLHLLAYAVGVALLTFAVRTKYPLNHVEALFGVLQVEVARYPIWLPAFFVGVVAYRRQWLDRLPSRVGRVWLGIGISLAVFSYAYAKSGWTWGMFQPAADGGLSAQSLFKSTWEAFFCTGTTFGLIVLFRDRFNYQGAFGRLLSENAYAVHIFHAAILVAIQEGIAPLPWSIFSKFMFVVIVGTVMSFVVAHWGIRRLPYAKRVF